MIISYASIPSSASDSQISQADILSSLYASASRASEPDIMDSLEQPWTSSTATFLSNQSTNSTTSVLTEGIVTMRGIVTKKKYKPVTKKVKPVIAELPKKYQIVQNIVGDLLETMPSLDPNPPPFQTTGRWYDCIASYAHTGTLFAILPTFPRCSNYAATSATSRILRFLVATFLQPVLHASQGYEFTSQMITNHKNSILHIPRHPLLAFKNCALLRLCAFLQFLHVFTISIRLYIGSLSRTSRASDQSPNWLVSASPCVPAAECYC